MRIIAGRFRGRKIDFPKFIRPTQDRVRETLFNVLAPYISGARVLDLFAGSGAFGIEALSRGARNVTFVDNNVKCIKIIKKNLQRLGIKNKLPIFKMDAFIAIPKFAKQKDKFDIILLDPPYYKGLSKKALIKLSQYDILSHNNIIVVEHALKDKLGDEIAEISFIKRKKFGDKMLSFYHKRDV